MSTRKTLNLLNPGERALIKGFSPDSHSYRQKLLAMGFTPGTPLQVIRKAPLGCPLELELRGFSLILRQNEASHIYIEQVTHE